MTVFYNVLLFYDIILNNQSSCHALIYRVMIADGWMNCSCPECEWNVQPRLRMKFTEGEMFGDWKFCQTSFLPSRKVMCVQQ